MILKNRNSPKKLLELKNWRPTSFQNKNESNRKLFKSKTL